MEEKKVSGSTEIIRNDKYAVFEHESLGRVFCFLSGGRYYALDGDGIVYDEAALSVRLGALGYREDDVGPFYFTKKSTIDEFMLNFYRLYPAQPYAVRNTKDLYSDEFLNSYLKDAYRTAEGFPALPLFDGERISGRAWLRGRATVVNGGGYWLPEYKRGADYFFTQDLRDIFKIDTEREQTPVFVTDGYIPTVVHYIQNAKIYLKPDCTPAFFLLCAFAVIERQCGIMLSARRTGLMVHLFTPLEIEADGIVSEGQKNGMINEYRIEAKKLNDCRRLIDDLHEKVGREKEFKKIVFSDI